MERSDFLSAGAAKVVFVLPGTYAAFAGRGRDLGDDGFSLQGCGADEVTIEGVDDATPVVKVSAAQGVSLRGLTLSGGRRGLSDVTVRDPVAGISMDGSLSGVTD